MAEIAPIVGQENALSLLSVLLGKGRVPHALLFTGIEGAGKRAAAIRFAMMCNCLSPDAPCGTCRSCRNIVSGVHPDVHLIEPSGAFIKIDQIREIGGILAMKPYEAKMRVVIICSAGAMNPEASNALLKMLEEPPDRTILILTTHQKSDLLPTILSRCQLIRFMPVLQNPEQDDDLIRHQERLLNELSSLSSKPLNALLAFAESLSKDKEQIQDDLNIILSWFRDIALCRFSLEKGQPCNARNLRNQTMKEMIEAQAYNMPKELILKKIDAVYSAMKNIRANSNTRLTMDLLVMRLAG
ncbi:MAG TPA: DNA polymerase III subunit delta' [Desulfobacteraceae bacterium]|nr:DNA polymerase III subunit delta' [Desulfobacteraceae bacterium]